MADDRSSGRVAAIRAFNRFYTGVIGVLDDGLLDTPYSLTEARVLFELAQQEAVQLARLRELLGIDAAYLSRMLGRFEVDGLVRRQRSATDGRRQVIRLTSAGRDVFSLLDGRSAAEVEAMLANMSEEDQGRLVAAMVTIENILRPVSRGSQEYTLRPPRPGDLGWVVHRHGALYADEYGWDERFESLVARIVADYAEHSDQLRERAWIAEVEGAPVGCVLCVKTDEKTAQLRLLLVEPAARGMGVGSRLVEECVRFARRAGYTEIVLWTNDVLADARRIYERAGFELVSEEPHHSFGHDLIGQYWSLNLPASGGDAGSTPFAESRLEEP